MSKIIEVNPTHKQSQTLKLLLDDTHTEILYGGAAGGGKSYVGCLWITSLCLQYPGVRCLIGRAQLKTLKETTLNTLFDVLKNLSLKKDVHYKYNGHSNLLSFSNGSEIMFKDLEHYPSDPNFDSLGSLEITAAFLDEANQLSEKAKMIVSSRIRYKLDEYNLIPKILMTCNPAKGWIYEEFYLKNRNNTLEPYKAFVQSLVTDNPYISQHYISNLQKLDIVSKKRLLYGEWEYASELSLFEYDPLVNSFKGSLTYKSEEVKPKLTHITVDVARLGKDKTVIVLWDKFLIVDIITLSKVTTDITAAEIMRLIKDYKVNISNVIIDADGVGGGLVDQLKGSYSFMNNSKAMFGENYQNLKTQCYYKLSEIINKDGISIYNVDMETKTEIIKELSIIEAINVDKDGKKQITSKDQIKKLIGKSPDYSDAIMLRMVKELKQETNLDNFKIFSVQM